MGGLGERLALMRAARSVSLQELSAALGVAYSDLLRLENSARHKPDEELVRRLALYFHTTEAYLTAGEEPAPGDLRAGFFRYYDSLAPAQREALRFEPIQGRIEAVLRFAEQAFPTVLERRMIAARVGYTPPALADVLRGAAPLHSHLLRHLGNLTGLGMDFFVRGDFFGGAVSEETGISPERLSAYYQVVQEAAAAGISPGALREAVRILAIREQER